jgi:hypothetical protein
MKTAFSHAQLQKSCARSQMQQRERNAAHISTPPNATKIFPLQQKARNQTHQQEAKKQTNHTPVFSFRST